jgi:hypothetical protein
MGSRSEHDRRSRSRRAHEGIEVRHKLHCLRGEGGACSCVPSYQAQVWSARDRKPIRRTFRSLAEARAWRQEAQVAVRRQMLRAPTRTTLAQAAEEWLAAAEGGPASEPSVTRPVGACERSGP